MSITKNLRKIYRMASPEHIEQGKAWYSEACKFCHTLAEQHKLPTERVIGMLAALSPQCSWPVNKRAVQTLLESDHCEGYTGYKVNVAKARRIFHGEDVERVLGKGTRYGAKVRAFYDNIRFPNWSTQVTVDTHAIRAAYDIADVPQKLLSAVFGSKLNLEIQDAYKKVAKEFNLVPCHFQAIVWLVVKDNL